MLSLKQRKRIRVNAQRAKQLRDVSRLIDDLEFTNASTFPSTQDLVVVAQKHQQQKEDPCKTPPVEAEIED